MASSTFEVAAAFSQVVSAAAVSIVYEAIVNVQHRNELQINSTRTTVIKRWINTKFTK